MLVDLIGLENLTSITRGVRIYNNISLTSLIGLENLEEVGQRFRIFDNDNLISLASLTSLTSIGWDITITNNDALLNLSGLGGINSTGRYIDISNNAVLTDLSGLENLNIIGGTLFLWDNPSLVDITALSSVTSLGGIGSGIWIRGSNNLASLNGLDNIASTTFTYLTIVNSPLLSTCEVQSICNYLDDPTNPATISGNAIGCSNRIEVEAACLAILPIELLRFIAVKDGSKINLSWATISENNNDFFEIEHSIDGIQFYTLGTTGGAGTITESRSYSFDHNSPALGVNYYRLRQVDFDGTSILSNLIAVLFDIDVSIYPNPTDGILTIKREDRSDVVVDIMDIMGTWLRKDLINSGQLDISSLEDGIYFVTIFSNMGNEVFRIVKH